MIPIGDQIYLRRLEQRLTQEELAKQAGIPQPNLSNIEKGKQDLTVSTLRKIAFALSVPPGEFFSDDKTKSQKISLSRRKIEKMAEAIARGELKSLEPAEREIAGLFQHVIPRRGKVGVRALNRAWLELRKRFDPREMNSLYERVEEYKFRNP